MTRSASPQELSRGANGGVGEVETRDEFLHPHRADQESWCESFYWDWHDASGERAGHCRFSVHPGELRSWLSLYLFRDGEWIAIDEPRLAADRLENEPLGWAGFGLEFRHDVTEPLKASRLRVAGWGRALSGPRAGEVIPVTVDLAITGVCAPQANEAGIGSGRFEQPTSLRGTIAVGGNARSCEALPFEGLGARDHTWGPRSWNMEWENLSLHGPAEHLRASIIKIPNVGRFASGYLLGKSWLPVAEADFRLGGLGGSDEWSPFRRMGSEELPPPSPLSSRSSGSATIKTGDGTLVTGRIEPLSSVEIDISHTDVAAERSRCVQTLVRFHLEGTKRKRSRRRLLGWLETNHFLP